MWPSQTLTLSVRTLPAASRRGVWFSFFCLCLPSQTLELVGHKQSILCHVSKLAQSLLVEAAWMGAQAGSGLTSHQCRAAQRTEHCASLVTGHRAAAAAPT